MIEEFHLLGQKGSMSVDKEFLLVVGSGSWPSHQMNIVRRGAVKTFDIL